ncbi:MAG TPA: hypothetical protein VFV41_21790 [Streptosporangiaceae bacterium]|nr:hypothetical protein [Streptosporangiaceae bacterium]
MAEMYGVQVDQLAAALRVSSQRASAIAGRWVSRRLAEADRLSPGPRWVWLTRTGLAACGLSYAPSPPALPRLAHIRAVTAVRLALEEAPGYAAAGAHWRSERRLRSRLGGRLGQRDHLPDAEVHWPEVPAGPARPSAVTQEGASGASGNEAGRVVSDLVLPGQLVPWAGECWAIEAELTPKTVRRTSAIMSELLSRTGDYGGPAAQARVPGQPPRYARVLYLCSPAAAGTVSRARAALGPAAGRVLMRALPEAGYLRGGRQARR